MDIGYFDGLYAAKTDPWGIGEGWYERRKRDLVLAALVAPRYRSTFEPGCSTGELTVRLAERSDRVLAADLHADAVAAARRRTADLPHVEIRRLLLPDDWPADETFDLVVLSEIGYFFTPAAWTTMCAAVAAQVAAGATVLACHWRHDFAERTIATGALHAELGAAIGMPAYVRAADPDLELEVWAPGLASLARAEGRP